MQILASQTKRRAVRRAIYTPCVAVATDGFRLVGQHVLDLSPRGMLVTCRAEVKVGDEVMVSFLPPGDGLWMNAEAEITRLIRGLRVGDPGRCAGLVFKNLPGSKRGELLSRLAGIPPTIPHRPLRFRNRSARRLEEPVFPLLVRRGVPGGVWTQNRVRLVPLLPASWNPVQGVFANEPLNWSPGGIC